MRDVIQDVEQAEFVLAGIGTQFAKEGRESGEVAEAYRLLAAMLNGKNYFVVTLLTDDLIFASPLDADRIVAPCGSESRGNVVTQPDYDESWYLPQWGKYRLWLQGTVNRRICLLELGAGFVYPSIIRFAFEKIVCYNQKARMYRVHESLYQITDEMKERCVSVRQDGVSFLTESVPSNLCKPKNLC